MLFAGNKALTVLISADSCVTISSNTNECGGQDVLRNLSTIIIAVCLIVPFFQGAAVFAAGSSGLKQMAVASTECRSGNLLIHWKKDGRAAGYYIYRRNGTADDGGSWSSSPIAEIKGNSTLYYQDKRVSPGSSYVYKVYSYSKGAGPQTPDADGGTDALYLAQTSAGSCVFSGGKLSLSWKKVKGAERYQIQYADNGFFCNPRTIRKKGTSAAIAGLSRDKHWYVRIRGIKGENAGMWALSENARKERTAKYTYESKDNKRIELRSLTGQSMYYNDTVQGSTSDGAFNYYALYDRKRNECRIAKVKSDSMDTVKVSDILPIHHGNDLTWDSEKKRIAAVHSEEGILKVAWIDPEKLTVIKNVTVKLPGKIFGAASSRMAGIRGFAGIAYESQSGQYILKIKKTGAVLVTDGEFSPLRYSKLTKNCSDLDQSVCTGQGMILRVQSGGNIICGYDLYGNYIARVKVKVPGELEGIYFNKNKLYGSVYKSYYTTKYKTVKKKVKKKGKWVWKKTRVKYKVLHRDNYVIHITDY